MTRMTYKRVAPGRRHSLFHRPPMGAASESQRQLHRPACETQEAEAQNGGRRCAQHRPVSPTEHCGVATAKTSSHRRRSCAASEGCTQAETRHPRFHPTAPFSASSNFYLHESTQTFSSLNSVRSAQTTSATPPPPGHCPVDHLATDRPFRSDHRPFAQTSHFPFHPCPGS